MPCWTACKSQKGQATAETCKKRNWGFEWKGLVWNVSIGYPKFWESPNPFGFSYGVRYILNARVHITVWEKRGLNVRHCVHSYTQKSRSTQPLFSYGLHMLSVVIRRAPLLSLCFSVAISVSVNKAETSLFPAWWIKANSKVKGENDWKNDTCLHPLNSGKKPAKHHP